MTLSTVLLFLNYLSSLPEEQRSVFIDNEFEEMSFKEISEKTGSEKYRHTIDADQNVAAAGQV